jgi:ABC-type Fe3+-hydroxamate transport system substrate-binding protein
MEIINHSGKSIPQSPQRIVSLVPSLTELLYDLDLGDRVVGITKFCVHPATWFQHKKRVGGTKKVKLDELQLLKPDLVIANREENVQAQVEEIAAFCPVALTDVNNFDQAMTTIEWLGNLTATTSKAVDLTEQIRMAFDNWKPPGPRFSTCYLIWEDPYMVAAGGTFIDDMLHLAGFQNVFVSLERYPAVGLLDIADADPELIMLSSEPFPFSQKHISGLKADLPATTPLLVDGEIFSWYGSRMLKAPHYFRQLWQKLVPA